MVGVFVDHDLIAGPVPSCDDVVVVGGHVPVEIAEPEAFPVSSREHEYMLRSKAGAKASVRKRLSDVITRIVRGRSLAAPLVVPGVNVRKVRVTCLVRGDVVAGR